MTKETSKRSAFGISGRVFIGLTVLLAAAGFPIYLSGNDVAILLLIAGFGAFVFGIGLLAAARSAP